MAGSYGPGYRANVLQVLRVLLDARETPATTEWLCERLHEKNWTRVTVEDVEAEMLAQPLWFEAGEGGWRLRRACTHCGRLHASNVDAGSCRKSSEMPQVDVSLSDGARLAQQRPGDMTPVPFDAVKHLFR